MSYNTKVILEVNDSKLEFFTGTRKFGRQHGALYPVDGEGIGEELILARGMFVKAYLQQLIGENIGDKMSIILQVFVGLINDEFEMVSSYEEDTLKRDQMLNHNIVLTIQLVN